jgi:transcriptional regulator with XRE-family HTH domain
MSSPGIALGLEVRRARSARGLSLRGLGDRIGVSPSLVSQIERDQVRPSLGTLVALAVELELSLDATFGLRPTPSEFHISTKE